MKDLTQAMDAVEATYSQISEIADNMLCEIIGPINKIIDEIRENAAGLSAPSIRDYMVRLQLRSYEISDIKEKSSLKADCAKAIREEKYASTFNSSEGTSGVRDNTAILASSEEIVVQALYNEIASQLKTKLDEIHRLIATLQSVLMSIMQEAKLAMNGIE